MMKIWKLHVPRQSGFAEFISVFVQSEEVLCQECERREIPNLLVEWSDGSDLIGDFVTAGARVVAKVSVAERLLRRFSGLKMVPIEFVDHPNLYRPSRITKGAPVRVWLPYEGPDLCELRVTNDVTLLEQSTVSIRRQCETCGAIQYRAFDGVEEKSGRGHLPRNPRMGLFVNRKHLPNLGFFRPEYSGMILCTDEEKQYIRDQNLENIEFLEVGDLVG